MRPRRDMSVCMTFPPTLRRRGPLASSAKNCTRSAGYVVTILFFGINAFAKTPCPWTCDSVTYTKSRSKRTPRIRFSNTGNFTGIVFAMNITLCRLSGGKPAASPTGKAAWQNVSTRARVAVHRCPSLSPETGSGHGGVLASISPELANVQAIVCQGGHAGIARFATTAT